MCLLSLIELYMNKVYLICKTCQVKYISFQPKLLISNKQFSEEIKNQIGQKIEVSEINVLR